MNVKRIGMIVPSSNTWVEPVSYEILEGRTDVTIHFARIPVTKISTEGSSNDQFSTVSMVSAAKLLADADVDVIVWNGTAGSWLGAAHDQAIVDAIFAETGVKASTTYLAYLDVFTELNVKSISLYTPYIDKINAHIEGNLRRESVEVANMLGLGLVVNKEFANVAPETIREGSRGLLEESKASDAVVYMCTNLNATHVLQDLEAEFPSVMTLDSIAVTLWHALRLVGAPGLSQRWGRALGGL